LNYIIYKLILNLEKNCGLYNSEYIFFKKLFSDFINSKNTSRFENIFWRFGDEIKWKKKDGKRVFEILKINLFFY